MLNFFYPEIVLVKASKLSIMLSYVEYGFLSTPICIIWTFFLWDFYLCLFFVFLNQNKKRPSCKDVLILAYQSLGVVYGDLSASPLYVYKTTFSGKLSLHENDEEVFGVFSFIFWTLTLIPLLKYICFVLSADDNGEGKISLSLQQDSFHFRLLDCS